MTSATSKQPQNASPATETVPSHCSLRLVEMNEPVRVNLPRIIDGLKTLDEDVDGCPGQL